MIWLDLETRSTVDVTEQGVYALIEDPTLQIISMHWAFDDGEVQHWRGLFAGSLYAPNVAAAPPTELFVRIAKGEEIGIWNEAFDRLVWNAVAGRQMIKGMPYIDLNQTVDYAAVARAHNIPGKLETAAAVWLPSHLQKLGNASFKPLWTTKAALLPEHQPLYVQMLEYGDHDILAMRALAKLMLAPDSRMMVDYRAAERINARGLGVDLEWARKAVTFRDAIVADVNARLTALTDGEITSVSQYVRHRKWAERMMKEAGVALVEESITTRRKKLRSDGAGYVTKVGKGFDKNVRAKVKEVLEDEAPRGIECQPVLDLIDLLDEAAGSAAVKYAAAVDRASADGCLRGMYVWSGAQQTGRFASGGMQLHNLIRRGVKDPTDLILRLMDATPEQAGEIATAMDMPLNALLGRLLRPTLVPRNDENGEPHCLVWADWSAIEARVCPWLSGDADAEPLLDLFRNGEDVYLVQAEAIVGHPVEKEDPERQLGKVAVLSLGFGGAVGAYMAMAKNYGIPPMPRAQVQDIVDAWREANPWARRWWNALWDAAMRAIDDPCVEYPAGRVTFSYLPALLDGTLVMWLPCGRPLFYPSARIQSVYRAEGEPPERGITFLHASYGRMPLWYGQLAENATQGTAASLLREALVDLELGSPWAGRVVGHTHDEIIAECFACVAKAVAKALTETMCFVPHWAPGLPLDAEVKAGWAYYDADPDLLAD